MSTNEIAGLVLGFWGLVMQVLGTLYWLGLIRPRNQGNQGISSESWSDVFKELLKVASWIVVVGVINVFIGALLLGANVFGQTGGQ